MNALLRIMLVMVPKLLADVSPSVKAAATSIIEKLRVAASKTPNPFDDAMVDMLDAVVHGDAVRLRNLLMSGAKVVSNVSITMREGLIDFLRLLEAKAMETPNHIDNALVDLLLFTLNVSESEIAPEIVKEPDEVEEDFNNDAPVPVGPHD